ncbi:MAG: glycosyltransferase family 4 protein [bacterium]
MNVLYLNYLFDKKYSSVGAAVHVKEFVNAAREVGVNIKSCDLNKFDSEEAAVQSNARAWLKSKLSRHVGQLNALVTNFGAFRREWRLISREKPDALLVRYNLLSFSAAIIAKIKRIPLVLEVNSPMALENRQFNQTAVSLPLIPEWIEMLNLKLATRVYTVSEALKSYFVQQGVDSKKISVVPNGVDVEAFSPQVKGVGIRQKYGLRESVVLGFVGSFHYWHGLESLRPYVQRLCAKYDEVKFLLVGDGPLKEELEQELRRNGLRERVVFAGYVEHHEIPHYLSAMDIVLAPYPAMTFFYFSPLKLFEYMAAARPVIASRVGQIEEMIEDGANGMLYEPGDIEEWINRSCQLIENPDLRTILGKRARQTVCEKYSWKMNATKVASLIKQSMNGKC